MVFVFVDSVVMDRGGRRGSMVAGGCGFVRLEDSCMHLGLFAIFIHFFLGGDNQGHLYGDFFQSTGRQHMPKTKEEARLIVAGPRQPLVSPGTLDDHQIGAQSNLAHVQTNQEDNNQHELDDSFETKKKARMQLK